VNVLVARHQIAQLVGASELNLAAVYLVQVVEVVRLEHLVGELGEAHAVCALQPGLHAVAAEHGAHPEVTSGLRQEVHRPPVLVPAQVVQHGHRAHFCGAVPHVQLVVGENPLDALPEAAGVRLHRVRRQRLALARLPARVPDPRRGPSEHREDVVPRAPEVQQADDREQVAHVEAVGRGVEPAVGGLSAGLEQPREPVLRGVFWERLLQNTPFIQRIEQSVVCRRRTVQFRAEREAKARSSAQNTRSMPR